MTDELSASQCLEMSLNNEPESEGNLEPSGIPDRI